MTIMTATGAAVRRLARLDIALSLAVLVLFLLVNLTRPANAMQIQTVKSPSGIEAWLVEDHSVPLMALRFAFEGGNAQDPAGKEGLANFLTAMLDEGAGELKSSEYQERMEDIAMRMSYEDTKDAFYGSFETLTVNRDKAVDLLRLALTKPRFDTDAVERIRGQLLAGLVYADRDPEKVASKTWFATAFAGHPYGRPASGTADSVKSISRDDLEWYRSRVFARSNLKVVAVGDIDAASLGKLLDTVFGGLAGNAQLTPVAAIRPMAGTQKIVDMNVPQSVAVFGLGAMARKDPDFIPAFVVNHILGGGGFASRLMEEVREKRGLAYSVYSYLQPLRHTSFLVGSVATKNQEMGRSMEVIKSEIKRLGEEGPTPTELENAKKYLVGSYALRFDTSAKIASQLLAIRMEDLGIDYVDKRNAEIEAVTAEDAKRVAKQMLKAGDLVDTIVGKPVMATSGRG